MQREIIVELQQFYESVKEQNLLREEYYVKNEITKESEEYKDKEEKWELEVR